MLGGNYFFGKTEVTAFEESELPGVDPLDFEVTNTGIGLIGEYETFNNVLSPTKGIRVQLSYANSFEFLGSDRQISRLSFFTLYYLPINDRLVSGFRAESMLASLDDMTFGTTVWNAGGGLDIRLPLIGFTNGGGCGAGTGRLGILYCFRKCMA
jgi:outer membrane protein assembly factor BamA